MLSIRMDATYIYIYIYIYIRLSVSVRTCSHLGLLHPQRRRRVSCALMVKSTDACLRWCGPPEAYRTGSCLIFLAAPATEKRDEYSERKKADQGMVRHGWSLHRNGSKFAAGRRGDCGLPAGEFEPGFVYAAAVVEDFAHVSHRAHLSTPEHRTLADWWLVRRHVHLKDLIFGKVLSVFRFGAPFEIPDYAEKASRTQRHNRRGDIHVVPSEDFYDAMIDPGCCAGEGLFL